MRKASYAEIILVVFGSLTLMLGSLVVHYRALAQAGSSGLQSIFDRNVEFITDFYGFRYRGVSNNFVDAHILYFGAYEKPLLYWLRDTAALLQDEGLVFLDIGANTGQHSLFMSKLLAEVHAFEPYPPILERLNYSVNFNSLTNVFIHPVGLGAENETLAFFEPPPDNQGTGSFARGLQDRSPGTTNLEIARGDDYLPAHGVERVDLVKIDVEGYEKNVLTGLAKTIERERPILVVEVTVSRSADELFKSQNELKAAFPDNYDFAVMPDEFTEEQLLSGAYEITPFGPTSPSFLFDSQWTVIAFPAEKSAAISRSGGSGD
ncbi:MAG: FkbM family methyltransferase [Acidobacteria bacterium]|nr:FkbM family methyltransferase [Acidobacteriota bacterium]